MNEKTEKLDILVTGVGGQGVVLASDIVGEAALAAGYDVKKTDTLGMAQRGGSVVSNLRIAPEVHSPMIREGEVDVILSFEKLEAVRWSHFLRPDGEDDLAHAGRAPECVQRVRHKRPPAERHEGFTARPTEPFAGPRRRNNRARLCQRCPPQVGPAP